MITHSGHIAATTIGICDCCLYQSDPKVEEKPCVCHEVLWRDDKARMRTTGDDYEPYSLHLDGGVAKRGCERTCYIQRGKQERRSKTETPYRCMKNCGSLGACAGMGK